MTHLPSRVTVREVGPRDGLQAEDAFVPTEGKVRLVRALVAAGFRRIEVTSFVRPDAIPQLRDAEALLAALGPHEGVVFSALVPNARGAERALAAGVDELTVFLSASEGHNRANVRMSVAESLAAVAEVVRVVGGRRPVSGVVATSFHCPFDGPTKPERVAEIARRLHDLGVDPILFGDTIGLADPVGVSRLVRAVRAAVPDARIGLHFHDTHGRATANILAGLLEGVDLFDASVGGLGGCPYAPGASGNVASEDVVAMLGAMGIETGIDLDRLLAASRLAEELVGRPLTAHVLQAQKGAGRC
jgi:hydroxymethylglutaryl-CoA lyase